MSIDDPATDGPTNSGTRWRWVAGIGALVLVVAAAAAGYGFGRSDGGDTVSDDAPTTEAAADPSIAVAATEAEAVAETGVPVGNEAVAETDVPVGNEAPIETERPVDPDEGARVAADGGAVDSAETTSVPSASGGVGYPAYPGAQLTFLTERVRDDGLTLRAFRGPSWDEGVLVADVADLELDGDMGWMPAPWCYPSADIRVAAAGLGLIDVGGTGWYDEPYKGRAVSSILLGLADGVPTWVIVVQVPNGTTEVRVVDPSGAEDVTAPGNGVALLALPGPTVDDDDDLWTVRPTFDVMFDGGGATVPVVAGEIGDRDDAAFREACEPPPPALPEPGEQPADPAGAEATIVDTMVALYTDGDPESDVVHLDDVTGVADAREQVAEGGFADAASSTDVVVEELVFTAPDQATFRYRLETSSGTFGDRFGHAVVVDGTWRIVRATFCQDLGLAGGLCDGPEPLIEDDVPAVTEPPT